MRNGFSARGFAALASAIVLLAACAHSGTSELVPTAGPNHTLTIISSGPGNAVTVTGAITSLTSSGFVFNAGFNENAMNVDDMGASITGASPFVGENVQVRGTGNTASLSATNVNQIIGAPKGVSYFSGTVSSASATSFVIDTASGYLPGTYNAQTTIKGGPLAVGKYAQAAGTGGSRS